MVDARSTKTPADGRVVIRDVNTAGWHVARVEPGGDHHGWAFSVGFVQTFDHPEVVVFGLPDDVQRALIDTIGRHLRLGHAFPDGHVEKTLAPPYRCVFRAVNAAWCSRVLPAASWFYGNRPFHALQLCWPDRAQRLPWEAGFDPDLLTFQPLLFHADPDAARIRPLLATDSHVPD
jgi:hypothetical protein